MVEPKSGGRLALKGFLVTVLLATVIVAATRDDRGAQASGMLIAAGIGAAYIISNLRKWKRHHDEVRGAGVAWTIAVFLILACIGSLSSKGGSGTSSSGVGSPATYIDPKQILLNDVKLDFNLSKEGFGNFMTADFTLTNPTQYRFKDFEIKCTHSAPSGTVIDSNTRTVYEVVEPKSTKSIKRMDMGLIHSQVARSGCEIINLVVVP